jgi:hypothetical protein
MTKKFFSELLVFGLFPSFSILETRKHNIWKLDLFPSSGEGRGEDT